MAGVATEKPETIFGPCGVCAVLRSHWPMIHMSPIYLFSGTQRGYREAEVSDGSFKQS